jgi:hypothetical protein
MILLRSSGGLLHDLVKFTAAYWAEDLGYAWAFEDKGFQDLAINPFRPDVVLHLKKTREHRAKVVYIEVQRAITEDWMKQLAKNYANKKVIVLDLNRIEQAISNKAGLDVINTISEYVRIQLDLETEHFDDANTKPKKALTPKYTCPVCGKTVSRYQEFYHKMQCNRRVLHT